MERDLTCESQLAQRIFEPGNLVHGTTIWGSDEWHSLIDNGICSDGGRQWRETRNWICTALLSREPLVKRYQVAHHLGPKDDYSAGLRLAIVISRSAVLTAFSGQIFAIGYRFGSARSDEIYDVDRETGSVFGIPP